MKVLNLYCGLGGNRVLWSNQHQVTAVDNDIQVLEAYAERFPQDIVLCVDAHQYLLENFQDFDFIWSSPPCQSHSRLVQTARGKYGRTHYPDMRLYEEIVLLRSYFDGLYCVENVEPFYGALIPCQKRGRHLLWTNFYLPEFNVEDVRWEDVRKGHYGFYLPENIYQGSNDPLKVYRNMCNPKIGEEVLNAAQKVYNPPEYRNHSYKQHDWMLGEYVKVRE